MRYIFLIKKSLSIYSLKRLSEPIRRITEIGIKICFIALLYSTFLLVLYSDFKPSQNLFKVGSLLVHSFSIFIVDFLIMGISFNRLQKSKNN